MLLFGKSGTLIEISGPPKGRNMDIKQNVSKLSFLFICLVVTMLFVGTCVLITTVSFGINPFKSETTAFLSLSFFSMIGMSVVALMLNVAANLSLIAEGRTGDTSVKAKSFTDSKKILKLWTIGTGATTAGLIILILVLNLASESRKFKMMEDLSNEVLSGNKGLVEKLAGDLKAGTIERLSEIPKKLEFLKKQRQDLPELVLIFSEDFEGQRAYRVINSWNFSPLTKENSKYPFYSCTKDVDCEKLKSFFEAGGMQKFSVKQNGLDEYSVYFPYEINGTRFILMFNKGIRFGSVGKYE